MGLTLAAVLFFAVVLAWILLPFLPALREARLRSDVEPLRVVKDSEVDVRHFARGFRRFLESQLGAAMERCRREGTRVEGTLADGGRFVTLAAGSGPDLAGLPLTPCEAVVVACGDLHVPGGSVFLREVGAEGSLGTGERTLFRAVLAGRDLRLGAGSQLLRWAHAEDAFAAGPHCELYGRVSAGRSIRIESGCRFERLNAGRVEFGPPVVPGTPAPPAARKAIRPSDLTGVEDVSAGRWWIGGDLKVPPGALVQADLVVAGHAHLGDGVRLEGAVKAHRSLTLGSGTEVVGGVVCRGDIHMRPGCTIGGPVICERTLTVAPGCRIGSPERPTTVSAAEIAVEPGAVAHGTVWAHARGEVRAAEDASSREAAS